MIRYVVFVTQDGNQKATRLMNQRQYVVQAMIINAISFGLGFAAALVYLADK